VAKKAKVKITQNFTNSLDLIERFLEENDAYHFFPKLVTELFDTIIPNLENFPQIGVRLLDRQPNSIQAIQLRDLTLSKLQDKSELREYISGDYIILYLVRETTIFLLSIKHHRQLSFYFENHWKNEI
jgi:hypothetical protein